MRLFLFLVIFTVSLLAGPRDVNRSGVFDDTASIIGLAADSLQYTQWFVLSGFEEALRVVFKVDDTTSAGFSSDSFAVVCGYQTGTVCLDTNESIDSADTCISFLVPVDTILTDSLGMLGNTAGTQSLVSDTLSCDGWAVLPRYINPDWDNYIRFWMYGDAGTCKTAIKASVDLQRRQYINVRNR